jgi:hypothetical protein
MGLSHKKTPLNMATDTTTTPATTIDQPTWNQLLGNNNWETLLNPLDLNLRNLILRCGDFIQTTYDSFNNDQNSIYCGSSRYGKTTFFNKVMLENPTHYTIVSFLYATARVSVPEAFILHSLSRESWDRESNWIGYIAVTSDERSRELGRREIYVVWRGTTRDLEWINVFGAAPESASGLLSAKSLSEFNIPNNKGMFYNFLCSVFSKVETNKFVLVLISF